jgi:predicted nucleic acid-binding Zn ribbon protein
MIICVKGLIIPASWDKKGNVVDLAIATRDEEEYLITGKDQVARLKQLLRQEVEIKGILRTKKGKRIIHVKRFSKLETTSNTDKFFSSCSANSLHHGSWRNAKWQKT